MERWRDGDSSEWWRETIEGGMLGGGGNGEVFIPLIGVGKYLAGRIVKT